MTTTDRDPRFVVSAQPKVVHVDVGQRGPGRRGRAPVSDHRHGGAGCAPSRGGRGRDTRPHDHHAVAVVHVVGGGVGGGGGRQEPAHVGADAAGRVPAGQPAAVDHVAEAGAAGGVRGQRHHGPGGGARPVPHGAGPEARPGRQHGLVLHQQAHARRQTGRGGARVAHAAARPQLRPAGQQPQVAVRGHRVAHGPAGQVQGAVHQQSDVPAVRHALAQSAARQGVSIILLQKDNNDDRVGQENVFFLNGLFIIFSSIQPPPPQVSVSLMPLYIIYIITHSFSVHASIPLVDDSLFL